LKAKRKQLRQKEGLGRKKNCAKPILDEEEEVDFLLKFSSPEHNMLMVSFCDHVLFDI
jgi:hypothetical protein